jgi:hypothetical protein
MNKKNTLVLKIFLIIYVFVSMFSFGCSYEKQINKIKDPITSLKENNIKKQSTKINKYKIFRNNFLIYHTKQYNKYNKYKKLIVKRYVICTICGGICAILFERLIKLTGIHKLLKNICYFFCKKNNNHN